MNPCGWRLKGKGGGAVNSKVFAAGHPTLDEKTRSLYETAKLGEIYPVKLPQKAPCALCQELNVTEVIHAMGPSLNPEHRQECLPMNKAKECMQSLLQKVFQRFVSLVRKDLMTRAGLNPTSSGNSVEDEDLSREASLVDLDTSAIPLVFPKYDHPNRRPKVAADWKNSLRHIVQKPSSYRDEIFFMNEDFVVIYDGFPKARVHLLLMPRREDVDTISHLRREHLPMLHRLFALSREIAFHLKSQDPSLVLGAGFHAIPSLSLLHCHLISQDMDSPFIRRKSHWNSFTTDFFVSIPTVVEMLQSAGLVEMDHEQMMAWEKASMKCHRCRAILPNIPSVKRHVGTCSVPLIREDHLL